MAVSLITMPLLWLFTHITIFFNRSCDIRQLETIPPNSILIAGHVYKAPLTDGDLFDPRLENLIRQNLENLEMVILTGDVFVEPTAELWERLKLFFANINLEFFIAPGNHDVDIGPSSLRTLFKTKFPNPYVRVLSANRNIIIEDSTQSDGKFGDELLHLVRKQRSELGKREILYIFRHHVAIKGMEGNSRHGLNSQPSSMYDLIHLFEGPTTVVAGDGGGGRLARLQCAKFKNVTFLVNGLGMSDDDMVLILKDGEIWSYPIMPY